MSRDWDIIDDLPASPDPPTEAIDPRRVRSVVLERREANRARARALLVAPTGAAIALAAAGRAASAWTIAPALAAACAFVAAASTVASVRAARSLRRTPTGRAAASTPATADFGALGGDDGAAARLSILSGDCDDAPR